MHWTTRLLTILTTGAVAAAPAAATPPAGVLTNVIIAQGPMMGPLKERVEVAGWSATLEDRGESEIYFQDFVVGPGGYSGWHSHPAVVLITVKEGTVEFYEHDCTRRTYTAGQSFTEGAQPHTAVNQGPTNVRLLIAYVVKRGEPRRIEAPQPPCAAGLGIP